MEIKNLDKLAIIANQKIKERDYWLNILSDLAACSFPNFHYREYTGKEGGEKNKQKVTAEFGRQLFQRLQEVSGGSDYTLHVILVSGLAALLGKYTGQRDIIIGTPIYKQEMEGEFINTVLPLRVCLEQEHTFKDLLMQVKQMIAEAVEHQGYPIEFLAQKSGLLGTGEGSSLLDTAILLQNIHNKRDIASANPGMLFCFCRTERSLSLDMEVEYNTSLYSQTGVQRLVAHFENLLTSALRDVNACLSDIDIMSPEEKLLLKSLNQTDAAYPREKTIHQLFEEQVEKAPDHIAVINSTTLETLRETSLQITYHQLNKQSNCLASLLIEKGVLPGTIVGIKMERSVEMIIGIFGILKAGGAYLPLDPGYPEERINYMLQDSNAGILITDNEKKKIANCQLSIVNTQLSMNRCPRSGLRHSSQLAYILYTSGSTGRPKGVMIQHRAVLNFMKGMNDIFDFEARDRILSLTTFAFDIFGLESLLPLCRGFVTVIGNKEEQMNPTAAALALLKQNITILQLTPSRLFMFLSDKEFTGSLKVLNYLLLGGEALPAELLEKVWKAEVGQIYNMYGPTETTIYSTAKNVSKGKSLNIGKPIANTRIYILNNSKTLQPIGTAGELWIAGDGLALGYINNVEITTEKFVIDPFENSQRMYRTGDLARLLENGEIDFLGRLDQQVKIRGFRIELAEIEEQLLQREDIKEALVISRNDRPGEKYLAAYIVYMASDASANPGAVELREFLARSLPEYMIPAYFIPLEKMPLTPNGKIDRKALPDPGQDRPGLKEAFVEPGTELEKIIANAWKELLRLDKIGINDNFFELGGNSMEIVTLNSRLREILGKNIPVVVMFRYRTIRSFINYLTQEVDENQLTGDRTEALRKGAARKRAKIQLKRKEEETSNV